MPVEEPSTTPATSGPSDPLVLIIPMGGLGKRFLSAGYTAPKPLIRMATQPMLVWLLTYLQPQPGDQVWLALPREMDETHDVQRYLTARFPEIDLRFVLLDAPTRGAAETLSRVLAVLPPSALSRRIVSLDCDTLYFSDVLRGARELPKDSGGCGYFVDRGDEPVFSYIRFEQGSQRIGEIAEKRRISQNANTGAYVFPDGRALSMYLDRLLGSPVGSKGEFYTSEVIRLMVEDGVEFCGFFVEDFECVGTPRQLEMFLKELQAGRRKLDRRLSGNVVLDLEAVPKLRDLQSPSWNQVRGELPPGSVECLQELAEFGITASLSFADGRVPMKGQDTGPLKFADYATRKKASEDKLLFPLNSRLRKQIGWA